MNDLSTTVPLLPLTGGVVLPGMVVTMAIESDEAKAAVAAADGAGERVLLVPRVGDGYAQVGTLAAIEDRGQVVAGVGVVVVRGLGRVRIGAGVAGPGEAIWVEADPVETPEPTERARDLARRYRATLEAIFERRGTPRMAEVFRGVADPGAMADMAGYSPELSFDQKVRLLETVEVEDRLELACEWAAELLAEITLAEKIRDEVTEGMEKTQREFLLRQQMAAIRRELGEDDASSVTDEYRRRLAEAELPPAVAAAVEREVGRLERMSEQSPEHGWIRTWIDTVLELPWGVRVGEQSAENSAENSGENSAENSADVVVDARAVLDADHSGLDDVKQRIVEHLAVRRRRIRRGLGPSAGRRGDGAILALVGPPGVGKTSLGESVARALGRGFARVALGGVGDPSEIRGHRRTYVGAQPGRIVRALREAGSMNPVLLLDEVDKLGADWRGDPSAALLEVLDPAQNHTFRDHYLEVDLDLSDVVFLATANVIETIPGPLLDRMEVINLDGYTGAEKLDIARNHLLARQLEANALEPAEVSIGDDAIRAIVEGYTREAGVRQLERQLAKLLRKVAAELGEESPEAVHIGAEDLARYLGRRRHFPEVAERTSVPGVATGLAVTGAGGDVLFVEATNLPGEAGLTITGQLGDVMKESAQIALSYVRSRAAALGADPVTTEGRIHLHVPAGSVPKDGPSAGVTMVSALASLATGRPVRPTVGMTGEVTLQGKVLPIGGVKQKVLAAHQAGLREVILPARNEPDLADVADGVLEALTVHLVSDVSEVLALALEPAPAAAAA